MLFSAPMGLKAALWVLFVSSGAAAQPEIDPAARAEVLAALEAQVPVPSRPLTLPEPAPAGLGAIRSSAAEIRRKAAESARIRAEEAGRGPVAKDERRKLSQAGQSAAGQARAEEVRKNARGGKPPHEPKP